VLPSIAASPPNDKSTFWIAVSIAIQKRVFSPISEMAPILNPRTSHIFTERNTVLGDVARYLVETHEMSKIVNDIV
jgi:hypothetical protein